MAFDIPTQTYNFTMWQPQEGECSGHAFLKEMQHDRFWIDRKLEILESPLAGGLLVISVIREGMDNVIGELLGEEAVPLDVLRGKITARITERDLLATEVEEMVPLPGPNSPEGNLNAEMAAFQVKLATIGLRAKLELSEMGKVLSKDDPDAQRINAQYLREQKALREEARQRLGKLGLPTTAVSEWKLPKGII